MKAKYVILTIVDLVVWYFFAYCIVYVLQNLSVVNTWLAALILTLLGVVGTALCPWLENTGGWKRLMRGE